MKKIFSDYFLRNLLLFLMAAGISSCSNDPESRGTEQSSGVTKSYPLLQDEAIESETGKSIADKPASSKTYAASEEKSGSYKSGSSSGGCSATQCGGTTKKGKRCKNRTKNCNGYCWRHGG